MLGIIFAVLLALWLENWMQETELQSQADEILIRIEQEIRANKNDLEDAIKDNEASIVGIQGVLNSEDRDLSRLGGFFIISAGATSDSAWESAKMTKALTMMPLDTVAQLAEIYDTQDYYKEYAIFVIQDYASLVSSIQFNEDVDKSSIKFIQHLAIINALARQLVASYDAYLENDHPKNMNDDVKANGPPEETDKTPETVEATNP